MDQRRQAVEATRAAIVAAAREELLSGASGAGFSIDAVARRAGLARMTLYNQFGSKTGLLEAVYDELAAQGGLTEFPSVMMRTDPLETLAGVVEIFCRFWTSDRELFRRLFRHGVLDPAVSDSHRERNERRRQIARVVVERLSLRYGPLDLERAEAADLLFTLTSFETYDGLASEDRSVEAVAALILHTVRAAFGVEPELRRAERVGGRR
ncbi:MAG TPA: TetR/AcrR family transcriptional regulator [Thermomicrobiaceae bacterium]|nr:TetR/AcrR family transcriptional regulator [Thermomicrobiaceae bacterium]